MRNTTGMIRARRRDSQTKRASVLSTVEQMLGEGTPVTFASVARRARVSTWLVYAPGIRDAIEEARTRQHTHRASEQHTQASTCGLETDLALARAEIKRLRAERDQQQQQLRHALGARLDNIAKAGLVARIEELTRTNSGLAATAASQQAENEALRTRITELEDDLTAARTSLRRMIRAENIPIDS